MEPFPINCTALAVAVIARMTVGALWFSPLLFLKPWMQATGRNLDDMKSGMGKALLSDLIGSIVMAFVLAHAVHYAQAHTVAQGAAVGFFNWLGFVAVTSFSSVVYEKKPLKLFFIVNGYQLIALLIMGALFAVWT